MYSEIIPLASLTSEIASPYYVNALSCNHAKLTYRGPLLTLHLVERNELEEASNGWSIEHYLLLNWVMLDVGKLALAGSLLPGYTIGRGIKLVVHRRSANVTIGSGRIGKALKG